MRRSILLAMLALATTPAWSKDGCQNERSIRSANSNRETEVEFVNNSSGRMKVYWINYDGKREFYSDVKPGRSYVQNTYMTHPWVVTDMNGQCVLLFRPLPGATVATINTLD